MSFTKKKIRYFFDSLIVLLNISNSYSIIPYLLFFQYYRGINSAIIFILNIVFIFFRFRGKIKFGQKNFLFILFILINVINYIFSLLTDTFGIGTVPFLFVNITFYIILINLFYDYIKKHTFEKSIWLVLRGYVWFSLLGIFSIVLMFFFMTIFNVNPFQNNIGYNFDLFASNIENPMVNYYFPYNLSIFLQSTDIRIPFFQRDGIITGIFHEPHTSTFLLTPSIFILLNFVKGRIKKIALIVLLILIVLTQASTTNILSLILVFFVFNFDKFKKNIVLLLVVNVIVVISFLMINPEIYQFVMLKISSSSAIYSLETLMYPFKPKTLVGSNFYDLSYIETYWNIADHSKDIGYFMFFFNTIFLSIFIYRIINVVKNTKYTLIALVPLYFLFHSTKIAMYSYTLSYLIFIIFIIHILGYEKRFYSESK